MPSHSAGFSRRSPSYARGISPVNFPEIVNRVFSVRPRQAHFSLLIYEKSRGIPCSLLLRSKPGFPCYGPIVRPNATKPLSFCCVGDNRKKWSAANAANFPSRCGTLSGTGNKIMVLFRLLCCPPSCELANPSYTITPGLSTGNRSIPCACRVMPCGSFYEWDAFASANSEFI